MLEAAVDNLKRLTELNNAERHLPSSKQEYYEETHQAILEFLKLRGGKTTSLVTVQFFTSINQVYHEFSEDRVGFLFYDEHGEPTSHYITHLNRLSRVGDIRDAAEVLLHYLGEPDFYFIDNVDDFARKTKDEIDNVNYHLGRSDSDQRTWELHALRHHLTTSKYEAPPIRRSPSRIPEETELDPATVINSLNQLFIEIKAARTENRPYREVKNLYKEHDRYLLAFLQLRMDGLIKGIDIKMYRGERSEALTPFSKNTLKIILPLGDGLGGFNSFYINLDHLWEITGIYDSIQIIQRYVGQMTYYPEDPAKYLERTREEFEHLNYLLRSNNYRFSDEEIDAFTDIRDTLEMRLNHLEQKTRSTLPPTPVE